MQVTFKDVLDRAYTTLITDYKLDALSVDDEQAFYDFLGGFLVNSIDMFDGCLSDLTYTHTIEEVGNTTRDVYTFDQDLSSKEVYILCLGVAIGWYKKCLDDVTQFKLHLSTKNFKNYSEQQNLQRRLERLNVMQEDLSKRITDYQFSNLSRLPFFKGG